MRGAAIAMKTRGLTLIEVLIVLLILGVIALIALPNVLQGANPRPEPVYRFEIALPSGERQTVDGRSWQRVHGEVEILSSDGSLVVEVPEAADLKRTLIGWRMMKGGKWVFEPAEEARR